MNIDANTVGLVVGLATIAGIVWKMASSVAEFSATVRALKEELEGMKSSFESFPDLEKRVTRLEWLAERGDRKE